MHKKLIAILIFMAVAPACIHATVVGTCTTGTLASIANATCTIGDKTFAFTSVSASPVSTSSVVFTPDTSNPNSPGFILTPAAGSSFSATNGSFDLGINFTVSITNPATGFLITGETADLNGAAATPTSSTNFFLAQSITDVCQGFADAEFQESNSVVLSNATTSSVGCIPTTSAGGDVVLQMTATNGTLSASSAAYYINETHATPEPASLLLFGFGLCALASRRRKFRTSKK